MQWDRGFEPLSGYGYVCAVVFVLALYLSTGLVAARSPGIRALSNNNGLFQNYF
jgi:hypothetical protein